MDRVSCFPHITVRKRDLILIPDVKRRETLEHTAGKEDAPAPMNGESTPRFAEITVAKRDTAAVFQYNG